MLSSSLYAMLNASKMTSPNKIFDYDYVYVVDATL